ncbi:hypothetical protein K8I28_10255, partial [bacterium]|nr:hypothetical protein [bacterium]
AFTSLFYTNEMRMKSPRKVSIVLVMIVALTSMVSVGNQRALAIEDNGDVAVWNMAGFNHTVDFTWAEYVQIALLADSVYVVAADPDGNQSVLVKYTTTTTGFSTEWTYDMDANGTIATDIVLKVEGNHTYAIVADYDWGVKSYQVTASTVTYQDGVQTASVMNTVVCTDGDDYIAVLNEGDEDGEIIDISDPTDIAFETDGLEKTHCLDAIWVLYETGTNNEDLLYIAGEDGIVIEDVEDPSDPTYVNTFGAPGTVNGIDAALYGGAHYVFVATGDNDAGDAIMYGINMDDPEGPEMQVTYEVEIAERLTDVNVDISNEYAYVSGEIVNGEEASGLIRVIDFGGNDEGLIAGYAYNSIKPQAIETQVGTGIIVAASLSTSLDWTNLDEGNYYDITIRTLVQSHFNWVSSNIFPMIASVPDPAPTTVFNSILSNLNYIDSDLGTYDPDGDQDFETIDFAEGYIVVMDADDDWDYEGWMLPPTTRYHVLDSENNTGEYNFLGYPFNHDVDVVELLVDMRMISQLFMNVQVGFGFQPLRLIVLRIWNHFICTKCGL